MLHIQQLLRPQVVAGGEVTAKLKAGVAGGALEVLNLPWAGLGEPLEQWAVWGTGMRASALTGTGFNR